jgi:hypothetical protein
MARPTKLGLVLRVLRQKNSSRMRIALFLPPSSLLFLGKRREFIGLIVINSDDRNSGKGAFHTIVKFQV